MVEVPNAPRAGTSRGHLGIEIVARVALVTFSALVLPHVFPADVSHFRDLANCMAGPSTTVLHLCNAKHFGVTTLGHGFNTPYRSVLFEFPPLPLLTLPLVGHWIGPRWVARIVFGCVMAGLELTALEQLRRAWPERRRDLTLWWSVSVIPVALLAWFRFDFMAVLFATIALVGLELGRKRTAAIVLGWLSKLWPTVIIAGLVVRRRWRDAGEAAVAIGVVTAVWYAVSPKGFHTFLQYRAGKGLEIESLFASVQFLNVHGHAKGASGAWVINGGTYAWANPVFTALLVAFSLAALWRAWKPGSDVVALCGAITVASMLFSRILSAQYVVWPAPFAVLLAARGNRSVGWSYALSGWLTLAYLLWFDSSMIPGNRLLQGVVLARNLCLVWLMVELFLAIRPANVRSPERLAEPVG